MAEPTAPTSATKALLSVPEAAQQLSISRAYLFRLIQDGRIRAVKIGHRRLVSPDAIVEFVAALESAS